MITLRFASLLAAVLAVQAALADAPPARLPRSAPEAQGVSAPQLVRFVQEEVRQVDSLHSLMLVRHGAVVAEGWWAPYAAPEPHLLFSLSKSFTSTAVGLAIADGRLSLDDGVAAFFPDRAPAAPSDNLQRMRVRDLLRMSTGNTPEEVAAFNFRSKDDLVRAFLAQPVPFKPGTHFVYNTPATYMLSAMVQKATGQTVRDYLQSRIFDPLGMGTPTWEESAQNISFGGFGLSLRTEDVACFGELYLHHGRWGNRQLVPPDWVEAATSLETANGSDPTSDWDQGYGYQFWRCRHGFFRGDGAFGQFCIVMPQYDAVLAITSGTSDLPSVMNVAWDYLLPALSGQPLPEDPAADRRLAEVLGGLVLPRVAVAAPAEPAPGETGRSYLLPDNSSGYRSARIDRGTGPGEWILTLGAAAAEDRIVVRDGDWPKGVWNAGPWRGQVFAANGAWTAPDTFVVQLCRYRTPFVDTATFHFVGGGVAIKTRENVHLTADAPDPIPELRGQPAP